MSGNGKQVLAYQRTPLIVVCSEAGSIPEDFLVSLTPAEREYVLGRVSSGFEELYFELLTKIFAAGITPDVHPLLAEILQDPLVIHTTIDEIPLALTEEQSTFQYFQEEFQRPFLSSIHELAAKTERRYGQSHIIFLHSLPRFYRGSIVSEDVVTFGDSLLVSATHNDPRFRSLYEQSVALRFSHHTWVGINPRVFNVPSLFSDVLERLSMLECNTVLA